MKLTHVEYYNPLQSYRQVFLIRIYKNAQSMPVTRLMAPTTAMIARGKANLLHIDRSEIDGGSNEDKWPSRPDALPNADLVSPSTSGPSMYFCISNKAYCPCENLKNAADASLPSYHLKD